MGYSGGVTMSFKFQGDGVSQDEKHRWMVTRVVLPRVIVYSRYHYWVSPLGLYAFTEDFTGFELEKGGCHGTSDMTGSVDTRSLVSRIRLALFEDNKWYRAYYNMIDQIDWGRNQRAEFIPSPCDQWKGAYCCNLTQFSGCTYNREAERCCPIASYNGYLSMWAQYLLQLNKAKYVLVHGLISSMERVCKRIYYARKWLLSSQVLNNSPEVVVAGKSVVKLAGPFNFLILMKREKKLMEKKKKRKEKIEKKKKDKANNNLGDLNIQKHDIREKLLIQNIACTHSAYNEPMLLRPVVQV
ncbi:leishmanolysin-like peptidase [Striga asiatica]|uniref:Leishmanolysin-like peptidase n=1 Tax=Striga asiatica TaxID=4170 RepID=A0A5A7PL49_STRAF|nr:leishmanolysin-like peptidase [Striga asiatica]